MEGSFSFMQLYHEANPHCALTNCSVKRKPSRQVPKSNWNNAGKKHRHESTAAALLLITLLSNMTQRNWFTLQNCLTILARSLLRFYYFWILWLFIY